ncbi:MAG: carbohydrate porin [Roseobacter sp.]
MSVGTGYDLFRSRELAAIGLNWARALGTATVTNPRDQFTTEVFYRYQPFTNVQITPSFQLIANPAYDPTQSME